MRRGSFLHRAIIWAERLCLAKSAAVISQTHVAVNHLKSVYPTELKNQRLVMIPTCADLDRFSPPLDRPSGPTVHGCIGTILSGWFRTDWLAAWLSAVAQDDTDARFDIVTRDDADRVRVALDPMNKFGDRLMIGPRPSEEMPAAVRGHDLTVMFYAGGEVSELGRSPTRMAEVLGCGLPVVANEGVGDVADIIRRYNVGVVVKDGSYAAMMAALDELKELRSDPDLPSRCRKAAEEVFSLQAGTEAYRKLYAKILGPSR
jgi:glycosyltransferase involved in cell wall biosynthesis